LVRGVSAVAEANDRVRIEIGFDGGQIMQAQVAGDDADRLARHLSSGGNGTVEIALEDGRCLVVLSRVLYLKRFAKESRVGFSG
jgi:hypothetical protein